KFLVVNGKVTGFAIPVSFRDLDAANIAQGMREHLRQTLRIPRELMGESAQSTRAATEAARVHAFEYAIAPLLEALRAELQQKLAPVFDASALIDYTVTSPAQSDIAQTLATNAVTCNAFTVQEIRSLAGMPREIPKGEVRLDPAPGT